ncbi:MAG: hypothetical protein MZW92_32185 [Comamonadaceae bacterium]|nr:hypothetical protein [Comamonadaceae bacterium]
MRAAADALHLTHSAVSQQITRAGRAARASRCSSVAAAASCSTAAGEALLRAVQSALARLDEGVQRARSAAAADAQDLRVTVLPSFAHRWLLPRTRAVARAPLAARARDRGFLPHGRPRARGASTPRCARAAVRGRGSPRCGCSTSR